MAQLGGCSVPAPVGYPGVSSSFGSFLGVHAGLGLGADGDELELHLLPSVSALLTPVFTSAKPGNAEEGTDFKNILVKEA